MAAFVRILVGVALVLLGQASQLIGMQPLVAVCIILGLAIMAFPDKAWRF
jgi:hypothetical protein